MSNIPSYIPYPASASIIPPPKTATPATQRPKPNTSTAIPSFPPPSIPPPLTRKYNLPTTSSLSTNVSDLLLGSILPPNLPKLSQAGEKDGGPGRPRELSSQREALSLPVMSNNFRRFVTKVGPVFWLQDRVEEVLFWRKPKWTWAWIMIWTSLSFKPRLFLLVPFLTLTVVLLHTHERTNPLPSLLGAALPPASVGTSRVGMTANADAGKDGFSTSTGPDGQEIPVVPPKEVESGVDYYMNIQAIQNLMGLISDVYDQIAPRLSLLSGPSKTPTFLPLSSTHVMLLLLPPTLFLPLLPTYLIPYLLLPLGLVPPFFFHPNINPFLRGLPRHRQVMRARALLENLALTDALSDEVGRQEIRRVEVWENERLDPSSSFKPTPGSSWSSRYLRAAERNPWVKITSPTEEKSLWRDEVAGDGEKMVLALRIGWAFIPGEDWRVDVCGLWSSVGTDEEGWCYSDDSWQVRASPQTQGTTDAFITEQNPAVIPSTDLDPPNSGAVIAMPLTRVTRRRRWWRRVYLEGEGRTPLA